VTTNLKTSLKWAVPILATLVVALEAGHLAHLMPSETTVFIIAIITAVVAWVSATQDKEIKYPEIPTGTPPHQEPQQQGQPLPKPPGKR
jgi:hypothetical protein